MGTAWPWLSLCQWALSPAVPPAGTGPIHINEVQCLGTEKSLWSCPFKNITQEDCKHTEDAAVRCNIPYMGYENLVRTVGGCLHPWGHGAWQILASGPPEWAAGGGPMGRVVGWPIISPSLHPIAPHAFAPGVREGLPWGILRWESQAAPVRRGVEGGPWGGVGAPWYPAVWDGVGQLLPAALPAASPCQLPGRSTRKKNHCGPTKRDFFFFY